MYQTLFWEKLWLKRFKLLNVSKMEKGCEKHLGLLAIITFVIKI